MPDSEEERDADSAGEDDSKVMGVEGSDEHRDKRRHVPARRRGEPEDEEKRGGGGEAVEEGIGTDFRRKRNARWGGRHRETREPCGQLWARAVAGGLAAEAG